MKLQRQSNAQIITPDQTAPIGHGGEARIYALKQDEALVAKVYHQPTDGRAHKLMAMLTNPPDNPMAAQGHISIAWPVDLLLTLGEPLPGEVGGKEYKDPNKAQIPGNSAGLGIGPGGSVRVVGFLMPRVKGMRPILDLYNPKTRRQYCPLFNYLYLHRTARNIAAAVGALHARGYCIGDVNESNILVGDTALVTLVDTDSFQVPDPHNGTIYRCRVGKAEFTPPELQGQSFAQLDRKPEHDLFGLAVVIFQLLMEGTHPFSGIYQGTGDPPPLEARIGAGHFTYSRRRRVPYMPTPLAPPWEILHPTLRELFVRCFESGHHDPQLRPSATHWQDALKEAESALVTCAVNNQHRYGLHLSRCPWCDRTHALGGRDPFPSLQVVQNKQHLQPKPSKRVSKVKTSQDVLPHLPTPTVSAQKRLLAKIRAHKQFIPVAVGLFVVGVCGLFKLLSSTNHLTVASDTSRRFPPTTHVAYSDTESPAQYNQGNAQPRSREYDIAIEKYSQALRLNPNDATAYVNRGNARYSFRDYQGAIEDFSFALRLNPNDATAYVYRGNARYNLRDYQGAIEDFNSALGVNPNQVNTYINLGNTHYSLGNHSGDPDREYKLAIEDFNSAARLAPNNAEAYFRRGIVRYEMAQYSSNPDKDYTQVIEDFNNAVRLNPNNADAYVKRGIVVYKLAQYRGDFYKGYTEAIKDFNAALRLNPKLPEAYVKRGIVRYEIAQYNSGKPNTDSREAVDDLQRAAKLFLEQGDTDNYQQALVHVCIALEKKCDSFLQNANQ